MSKVIYTIEGGPVTVPFPVYQSEQETRGAIELAHQSWHGHIESLCAEATGTITSDKRFRGLCLRWQGKMGVRVLRYHGLTHLAAWYWRDREPVLVVGLHIERWQGEVLELIFKNDPPAVPSEAEEIMVSPRYL